MKRERLPKTVRLSDFTENPDNPSTATDEAFARLVEKLRRVPEGLAAQRIAYVTDHPAGKCVVIAGNKRLRALKIIRGVDGFAPAEWFEDVTAMSPEERREFVVVSNVNEGKWVAQMLVEICPPERLRKLMDEKSVADILADIPKPQKIAEDSEVDIDSFSEDLTLKLTIRRELKPKAEAVLHSLDDDPARALVKLVVKEER